MRLLNVKRALISIMAAFILIISVVAVSGIRSAYAAETTSTAFESRNVLEDLAGSSIDGKPFNLQDYGFDKQKETALFSFAEYCYSYYTTNQSDYGLYVYIYNPQGIDISENSAQNILQISFGNVDDYNKYPLLFLNKSEKAGYENLFYKFKIVLDSAQRAEILGKLDGSERVYKISGVELLTKGEATAVEYNVGEVYRYSGYAAGYGSNSNGETSLTCTVDNVGETVRLDVHDTFYRTQTSSKGKYYQNQINSVYFAVPNRLLEEYGRLQRIKAEWYEYETKYMAVTSNKDFYDKVLPYMGEIIEGEQFSKYYRKDIYYGLASDVSTSNSGFAPDGFIWNYFTDSNITPDPSHGVIRGANVEQITELNYLFYTASDIKEYDPFANITSTGGIGSTPLKEYIYGYDKFRTGSLPIKDGKVSADLFESDIPAERHIDNAQGKVQKGYSYYDFDADLDIQSWLSYGDTNPGFWTNAQNYGFWRTLTGQIPDEAKNEKGQKIEPIMVLSESDITGTAAEVSKRLYVHSDDVGALQTFYKQADDENKAVVLFRFAVTDYKSGAVDITWDESANILGDHAIDGQAYIAKGEVFLNFDIIQLNFTRDGVSKIIPAVSSPKDIIPPITPPVYMPSEKFSWLTWAVIMGVAIVIFIATAIIEKNVRRVKK